MIHAHTAIRAWVEVPRRARRATTRMAVPWRPQPYGQRVLVFDTETTTDHTQRLLFGFFRLYNGDRLVLEGLIAADTLDYRAMEAINAYAAKSRLPIYSRERFIEEVFYPEVYELGTLCVGFNLPFDLARVAMDAGCGRGENRRKFRIVFSRRLKWHDLRIEAASGHAAFIGFVPKRKLFRWERPFFKGRFLDLSTLTRAFTGSSKTLKGACTVLDTHTRKMGIDELGHVNRATLTYGRQDVRATWALYRRLRHEYAQHPFATFVHERARPKGSMYMGEVYSGASIAKQYLRLLGFQPLLEAQPHFNRRYLGYGAASYYGGRAEVRVRGDSLVTILDFTSMYPTVFILQQLQSLIEGPIKAQRVPRKEIGAFIVSLTREKLYYPSVWPLLNCLVLVEPNGAILPVRFKTDPNNPYTIAVTPYATTQRHWYTLADVIAGVLLGGPMPRIVRAIRFVPGGQATAETVLFRGSVPLRTEEPLFRTVIEERQRAKRASKASPELARLEMGLKVMANSGAYGIFAEVNVVPHNLDKPISGHVYSNTDFECEDIPNERPGVFSNPIIASFVTGGARLMLALFESEVRERGGTYAFCDTDSLAIVSGEGVPNGMKGLSEAEIGEIVERFDRLNPYRNVDHLLKREYAHIPDLRCYAISAKRYVLYRIRAGRRIEIIKASESGLGAILGRTPGERTAKLARRTWLSILLKTVKGVNSKQRRRARPLVDFDVPLRRKFPISQPHVLKRFTELNRAKRYESRVKPYGFVQSVTPATQQGQNDMLPIAPFETDLKRSKRLTWIDYTTGRPVRLDWNGEHGAGAIDVLRMSEFIDRFRIHPESKAADRDGNAATESKWGLLERLVIGSAASNHIGKEIDRLDQDDGATLERADPNGFGTRELTSDIETLRQYGQREVAQDLGISERRWRDIMKGEAEPRRATAERIARLAARYRLSSNGSASTRSPMRRRAKRRLSPYPKAALRRSKGEHGA